jgi:hypothetical protein
MLAGLSLGLALLLGLSLVVPWTRLRTGCLLTAAAVWLSLQIFLIQRGRPLIDDFYIVSGGAKTLLHGHNPYLAYYQSTTTGITRYHYTYGPATLLLTTPFRLLGDVRYASLAAIVVTLGSILWVAKLSHPKAVPVHWVAALLLAQPFSGYMVANMWSDVFPMLALVLWILLLERHPRVAAVLLGIGIAAKVTILLPLAGILIIRPKTLPQVLTSLAVAVVISAPFAIWTGPAQFVYDTVGFFVGTQRLGFASLSLGGVMQATWGARLPLVAEAGCLLLVGWWMWGQSRRVAMSLWWAGALASLFAVFLSKWTESNYYYMPVLLVSVALCLPRYRAAEVSPERTGPGTWTLTQSAADSPRLQEPST